MYFGDSAFFAYHVVKELPVQTRSWVNGAPSASHGSHVTGVRTACERVGFTPYVLYCHVITHGHRWAGPVRDELIHPALEEAVATRVAEVLAEQVDG